MRLVLVLGVALSFVWSAAVAQVVPRVPGGKAPFRGQKMRREIPPALRQALAAVGKVRYSGKRVMESKVGADRQRHIELVVTDGPRSRIEFPSDSPLAGQVIVETPKERLHFLPGSNQLQVLPPRREEAFKGILQMANRGMVTQGPGGSVAGQTTTLISISDRQGNVLQQLWIEPRSGMILKREIYDRTGTIEASFEFTEVNLQPIINRTSFVLDPKGVSRITPDDVLRRLTRRGDFQSVRIPEDSPFRLEGARIQKIAGQQVLIQQYSGNGHRVLLYQLKGTVDSTKLGKLERPDLQIFTWQAGGSSFVLLGDLPDAELRDLAHRLGG